MTQQIIQQLAHRIVSRAASNGYLQGAMQSSGMRHLSIKVA